MFYLADFIREFGNELGYREYKKAQEFWALPKRAYHNNKLLSHWIHYVLPDDLRESTVIPCIMKHELKKDFYFSEIIH